MSRDLNQCNFIGRLGKEVDLKYSTNGNAVVNFSIACSDDYKDKTTGDKIDRTNWINIVAFGKLAEIIGEYCKKGDKIFISGKQTTRKWQDSSGADKYSTEIVASEIQMLGGNREGQQSAPQQSKPAQQQRTVPADHPAAQIPDYDDDIPF